jgi:hypothetical protein
VALLKELAIEEDSDEPDYRSLGTAAHAAAHECLVNGVDAWETIGERHGKHEVDEDMANAVQVYLDEVRSLITPESKVFYEFGIDAPDFHPSFYGTLDCGVIDGTTMYIRDYKHGEGIAVDTEENPQIMYYAYGLLRHHPEVETVNLRIVQPRIAWAHNDPWVVSADYIRQWAETTLHNAMLATELDNDLDAGPWCRFCPAKLVCPLMTSLFGAAMQADPKRVPDLSDESLGRSYQYTQAVKFYLKALEEAVLGRLNAGKEITGVKLVNKKSNRVFKDGAMDVFVKALGEEAYTKPELRTPAEMERVSPAAKKLVHEWAFVPVTGVTVALSDDRRPAVKVQTTTEAFGAAVANLTGETNG